jgi:hypothetical protein
VLSVEVVHQEGAEDGSLLFVRQLIFGAIGCSRVTFKLAGSRASKSLMQLAASLVQLAAFHTSRGRVFLLFL